MRVEILSPVAGPNWMARPGQEMEMPDAEAESLIRAGIARRADLEAAVLAEPETAVMTGRPRSRRGRTK